MIEGNLLKMESKWGPVVEYFLPVGEQRMGLNELVGKEIHLEFQGRINDVHDGSLIKKSYGQGYSYKNFTRLACCDSCIIQPEKCHYHLGTCREPAWGEKHCMAPHVVYLSLTSTVKVGVTRRSQVPTRWIDQGAVKAVPLVEVSNRRTAGLIEVEIKSSFDDKTNWRKMLSNEWEDVDLEELKEGVFQDFADLFDDHNAEEAEDGEVSISYPVDQYPQSPIRSLTLDKHPAIGGVLRGIKGQYLIFDQGVFNVRNHQGYWVTLVVGR